jgi:glycine/D-amino acid oxidase-like deaminating enzyme
VYLDFKHHVVHSHSLKTADTSVVVTPDVYLPWLRAKLESAGVRFLRAEVPSLAAAAKLAPCDLIVNASGNGARFLLDVADEKCVQVRGQTMLVKCGAPEVHIRHALRWDEYTYVLPRGDGTAILGGIKEFGNIDPGINDQLKRSVSVRVRRDPSFAPVPRRADSPQIHKRCHAMLPAHVPAKFEDLEIVRDLVGIRPEREGGVRVELEDMGGLKVVHAYGLTGGGYVYSYGMSAAVKKLADSAL